MILQQIKILCDENVSPKIVKFLREKGIDVLDVKEKGWYGKEDEKLLEIALKEKRFVLTHDSDFGMLSVYKRKKIYGIIYIRVKNLKPTNIINVFERLFSIDINENSILVLEETRVRIRNL